MGAALRCAHLNAGVHVAKPGLDFEAGGMSDKRQIDSGSPVRLGLCHHDDSGVMLFAGHHQSAKSSRSDWLVGLGFRGIDSSLCGLHCTFCRLNDAAGHSKAPLRRLEGLICCVWVKGAFAGFCRRGVGLSLSVGGLSDGVLHARVFEASGFCRVGFFRNLDGLGVDWIVLHSKYPQVNGLYLRLIHYADLLR
jgi:hypothetical protein